NCGCLLCYRDRTELGCEHPGHCIETAKMLIESILPKWNPEAPSLDLCDELCLTEQEREWNKKSIQTDQTMAFDPDFTLSNMDAAFRIF
ncbi:hypothetical protein B0H14DRAFT_2232639, partial [Mycena olivaceomarginata]